MCRMVGAGQLYFLHWSHVEKINRIFTVIKQSFKGNFIELDFQKILMKRQNGSTMYSFFWNPIQYSLRCSLVEHGNEKYVYRISSDSLHDLSCSVSP